VTFAIKSKLNDAVKVSLKKGEKREVGALRLILAAIKQQEVDTRIEVDDDSVLAILGKMAKQRRESIFHFEKAGRDDLVAQEQFELALLASYLPAALSDAEIAAAIDAAITSSGSTSPKDMGKVMGLLKTSLQGRADMGAVGATVKARLAA
jgi:uncharacterized protein YqeY